METDGHLNYKCNRRTDTVTDKRTDTPYKDVRTDRWLFNLKLFTNAHKGTKGLGDGVAGLGRGWLTGPSEKIKVDQKFFTVTPLRQRLNRQNWQTLERQTLPGTTDFNSTDFNSTDFGTTDFHRLWNGDGFRDTHRKKFTHPILPFRQIQINRNTHLSAFPRWYFFLPKKKI